MLDAGSLQALGSHFERLMGAIERKIDSVRFIILAPYFIHDLDPFHITNSTPSYSGWNWRTLTL